MSLPHFPDLTVSADVKHALLTTIASDTTTAGDAIDCINQEGTLHVYVETGAPSDQTQFIVKLTESATSGGSYTAIDGATKTYAAHATANDKLAQFAFKVDNRKERFVKVEVVTSGGGSVSVPIAISVVARKKIAGGSGIKTDG